MIHRSCDRPKSIINTWLGDDWHLRSVLTAIAIFAVGALGIAAARGRRDAILLVIAWMIIATDYTVPVRNEYNYVLIMPAVAMAGMIAARNRDPFLLIIAFLLPVAGDITAKYSTIIHYLTTGVTVFAALILWSFLLLFRGDASGRPDREPASPT